MEKKKLRTTKIAILGLPNTGKSQIYNELTHDYALVANYPSTTVEMKRKLVTIRGRAYEFIDTPGLHGLYVESEEELSVRDFLLKEEIDGIIQCIDANRIRQSLRLAIDLLELKIPLAISLNAVDETALNDLAIDGRTLSQKLGVPVAEHSLELNRGVENLHRILTEMSLSGIDIKYGEELEDKLDLIQRTLPLPTGFSRKLAILLLEGDTYLLSSLSKVAGNSSVLDLVKDIESFRKSYRGVVSREVRKKQDQIINAIFDSSVKTPQKKQVSRTAFAQTVARLCRQPLTGFPILTVVVVVAYILVVHVAGSVEGVLSRFIVDPVTNAINENISMPFFRELLVGYYGLLTLGLFNAFVTVLPILTVFFFLMGVLEDVGYLPNLSVLTKRILGKIGLTGKSVMSLVLGFGCKTMATLTTKGISSRKERLIAIYLIAFAIPCSAQLAIDMAILGRVGALAFVIAVGTLAFVEILAGLILNRLIPDDEEEGYIQELPPIRMPNVRAIGKKTLYRLLWFLKEAVPIFLIASLILFLCDWIGLLDAVKGVAKPLVVGWLGLPLDMVEVLILSLARHEAAAGLLLIMVENGALSYMQSIVAVVITTMFVPCFANIVAMCRQSGVLVGLSMVLVINGSSFVLAGFLRWILTGFGVV